MKKIVIVEDESIISLDLKTFLIKEGYKISGIFKDGEAAASFIKNFPPDLVIMDYELKGPLNGFETAKLITHLNIPILFITGLASTSSPELKNYKFITKPFEEASVLCEINSLLFSSTKV